VCLLSGRPYWQRSETGNFEPIPDCDLKLHRNRLRRALAERKSAAGRKPCDEVLIFKALIVHSLYNLSDEQMEYQLRDRLSAARRSGPECASLA
jgi:hypothetical protein